MTKTIQATPVNVERTTAYGKIEMIVSMDHINSLQQANDTVNDITLEISPVLWLETACGNFVKVHIHETEIKWDSILDEANDIIEGEGC